MARVRLSQLSYKAFSYPGDEQALESVKKIPGVNKLFHWIIDNFLEEYIHLNQLYTSTRVNPESYPSLHGLVREGCEVLDCPFPEVFVAYNPQYNASTSGVDRVYVSLNSYLVEDFSEEELLFILGHEMGHIKAGHVLYSTVARFIVQFLPFIQSLIPFNIGMLYQPMLLGLYEWSRRAEFTSDRAGLLAVQDIDVALSALSKMAGKLRKYPGEHNLEVHISQADEVAESKNQLVKVFLFLDNMMNSHPYTTLRLKMLREWYDSVDYRRIVEGNYERDVLGEHELGQRIKCRGCGSTINAKLPFCPSCGLAQEGGARRVESQLLCPNCKAVVTADMKFCQSCGTKL